MSKTANEVTVTLTAAHKHKGQPHAAGDKITVRRRLLPWLERKRVIAAQGGSEAKGERDEPGPAPSGGA